ncbi:carboxymuconolactone decarboxylase family protein [Actinoplanes sp. NPDC051851]|uniref:carboxymuconolactone decarboxylase family protein n=1 Tax=Actinoplanes sp. NPDC051851 TaxID=3154753 RepID=UPI0034403D6D
MSTPAIPLRTDDQLTERERKLLRGVPDANIFRAVANAPASLKPFLELAGSVLLQSTFDRRLRELAILRVATVTGSTYEREQHERIGRLAGLTDDEIDRVRAAGAPEGFDPEASLVLAVAEDITRNVRLRDDLLHDLIQRYDVRKATELILCVSYFNLVSRFLESARVPLEDRPIL